MLPSNGIHTVVLVGVHSTRIYVGYKPELAKNWRRYGMFVVLRLSPLRQDGERAFA